jgi:hypothetical protein
MNIEANNPKASYYIPNQGNYYRFLTETVFGLYNMLKEESILDSLECKLWYRRNYDEIVQMFSRYPIIKPQLKKAAAIGPDIKTLKQVRLGKREDFDKLIPMATFLSDQVPLVEMPKGITVIKRVQKRVYLETDELAEKLKKFRLPVKVVQLEKESFANQVNIMRNTLVLIAPHGAGTMNQIFMPKGGQVIELFPKGYSNWHAKAVADVFEHNLIEIESEKPGVLISEPSEEIRKWIETNGWPDRKAVQASRKQSEDLLRFVHDVNYSINPRRVVKIVKELLQSIQPKRSILKTHRALDEHKRDKLEMIETTLSEQKASECRSAKNKKRQHSINVEINDTKAKYFIPIFGSYYHFLNESVLGLYNMLKEESVLDSLDCRLWYQGNYTEIVQMFSCHPIVTLPVIKPYFKDASAIGPDIKTLKQVRLGRKEGYDKLIPLVDYLNDRIPLVKMPKGITVIKRVQKRVYLETDELVERLTKFQLPLQVVQLEKEPFANQVNIMRNTLVLVAPHGAGTMNQIFMPKGGQIIELFPKGYSNWHAKAVSDVFGHNLVEIESKKPGVFGREPSEEIRKWIKTNGWPDRRAVQASRKQSEDLLRVVRDVRSYSINPARIIKAVKEALSCISRR